MLRTFLLTTLYCLAISLAISCKKDPVNGANPGGTARYSIEGTPGSCSTPVVAGIYSVGLPMTPANTVTISVNVTVRGSYSMKTTSVNGVYFSGAGLFTTAGKQTIVLTGNGTPVRPGSFPYVPSTTNTCNFSVSFNAGVPAAIFTYAGAPANCTAPVVGGTYFSGVGLGAGNYVDLTVNVSSPGNYSVTTNNANGIEFSASGIFTVAGTQFLRLTGSGTPAGTGSFAYKPIGNGCIFNINVTSTVPAAVFTYNGAPGNCTGPLINGFYVKGFALNSSNTVVLGVDVSVPGSYSVSTNTANGVAFSASGSFTTTGANTITLTSTNRPTDAGMFSYKPTGGCSFDINYAGIPPPNMDYLVCTIDGVATDFNEFITGSSDQSGSPYTFLVEGEQSVGTDQFSIVLVDNFNPIVAGTYDNLSVSNTNRNCQITYTTSSGTYGSSIQANTFVVNLTSITATKATGTFSGIMKDNLGTGSNTKIITAGSFSISY
jgi:hypothetical protein